MKKKLAVIFLILVLITSACGTQQTPIETVAPASTETQGATATQTAPATETLPAQTSVTSTPETPVPTNPADCINSAVFVADVTIPDNSQVNSSTTFTKTWRIRNTGTCIWSSDYVVAHYSEERMLAPSTVPLSLTLPNETVDISMDLTAPRTSGLHRGFFVIKNPAGLIMKIDNDSRLWVVIDVSVSNELASAPTAQGTGSIPVTGNDGDLTDAACPFTVDAAKVTETITAVNAYRADNGLAPYAVNELLTKAATAHANDIACNKLFAHIGSNDSTPTTRVAASGYTASSVTENVYGSYPPLTGQGAVDWWKNDKTDIRHNQNLLSTTYTEIGVAYSYYKNFGYYVLVFARPK
jgi:uncharacterized protein YkwD